MTSMLDRQRVKTLWRKAASLLPPKQAKISQRAPKLMAARLFVPANSRRNDARSASTTLNKLQMVAAAVPSGGEPSGP
jgi:hypothetical protein